MKKIIVANWKMNGSYDFIDDYFEEFTLPDSDHIIIFCPPSPYLGIVKTFVDDETSFLGSQDCHESTHGAFTGNVSATMLQDLGCTYTILGHSERRQNHHETDSLIQAKAQAALKHGITPIICVGETLEQRQSGQAVAIVETQLKNCIPNALKQKILIAYEPVWAIGTGLVATSDNIIEMHTAIKSFTRNFDTHVLYGGSVNENNAAEILALTNVDGVLVGGASLKPKSFMTICSVF